MQYTAMAWNSQNTQTRRVWSPARNASFELSYSKQSVNKFADVDALQSILCITHGQL